MKIAKGVWGNPPIDWHYHNEDYQPVAEIYQDRGNYEYLGCPKQASHSAPKMSIFFSSGNKIMGDVCKLPQKFNFHIEAKTIENIKEIVVFRNNKIVKKFDLDRSYFEVKWEDSDPLKKDFIWYYVRL